MIKNYFFLLVLFFCVVSCNQQSKKYEYVKIAGYTQGTTYHVSYENSVNDYLKPEIDSILKVIDYTLSIYNPESIISRINDNDSTVEINDLFKKVYEKSIEVNNNSGGAFDITVGPLVNAWGFGPNKREKITKQQINSLMPFIGMDKIKVQGNKLIKKFPQVRIDFNAIAQGFTTDVICNYFDSKNIKNYMVEVGGEVRTKGKNPKNESWHVGIDKPVENMMPGEVVNAIISISNKAIATSGDYRKFFVEDGKKYSHHIDPKTGYPAKQNLLSASIIANDCITADAYGTAFMVMGLEKSKEFLKNHPELNAYLIYSDNAGKLQEYMTNEIKNSIEILQDSTAKK